MCDLCRCELPRHRDGHVTKATIKAHNRGTKHTFAEYRRDNVWSITYVTKGLALSTLGEDIQRDELAREERVNHKRHILLLAVVATHLRATHGSMDAARTLWTSESDTALNQLESSTLKDALRRPAAAHVAKHHVLKAASNAWLVVNLLINVAGI